jgi:hypothetical protein
MPRHWPDAKDRNPNSSPRGRQDFEARAWAMGQLVSTQARLILLADRAGDPQKPWPEFAEYDCAACHHDLRQPSARQQKGYEKRKPGSMPWSNHLFLTTRILESLHDQGDPQLVKVLGNILQTFNASKSNRKDLAKHARDAASFLDRWQQKLDTQPTDQKWVDHLFESILLNEGPTTRATSEEVMHLQVSLAALYRARIDLNMPALPADLRNSLFRLSTRFDLPANHYDSQPIRNRMIEFLKIATKGQ